MADYLWRLAVVLPLILLAIVAVLLVLHRRRGGALPGWLAKRNAASATEPLVLRTQSISPVARVAILRFAGQDHLIGLSGDAMLLIASSPAHPGASAPPANPEVAGA